MPIPVFQVDAFTDRPFAGNPAAVCVLPGPREDDWMQAVAAEMNLSETAFVYREHDGFRLRWFTPAIEVDLCGHATLATAHALWEAGYLEAGQQARFFTRSGTLTADPDPHGIALDFPAEPATEVRAPGELADGLGLTPVFVGKNRFDYLVELPSAEAVRNLQPDIRLISRLPSRGVIVTAAGDTGEFDFVSRFFAPNCGVDEDPVCGSAHCCLAPYWGHKLDKRELVGFQASARGGVVRVRNRGDRVTLIGRAVTVLRGELVD